MNRKYNSVISSSSTSYTPSVKMIITSIHAKMFQRRRGDIIRKAVVLWIRRIWMMLNNRKLPGIYISNMTPYPRTTFLSKFLLGFTQ